jgi:glycosyltransferase involved in cell wall biosynthesis
LRKYNPKYLIRKIIIVVGNFVLARPKLMCRIKPLFKSNEWLWRRIREIILLDSQSMVDISRFEEIHFDNIKIYFAKGPLSDHRGIGRVSKELFFALKKNELIKNSIEFDSFIRDVYFYPSIHWCPNYLQHPCVVMVHDVIPLVLPELFPVTVVDEWRTKFTQIANQADHIVTISEVSAKDIAKFIGVPNERISVVYNGVNCLPVKDAPAFFLPDAPFIVFVGSNDHHKNLDVVLKALSHDVLRGIHIVLVGDNRNCESQAKNLGVIDRVHFLGRLNDEDLGLVISRALALVFPSLYEGFGLPPFEAALLGTPSICSNNSAMSELLADVAILVDPYTPSDWVDAIKRLQENIKFRNEIASKAQIYAKNFSWSLSAEQYLKIFSSVATYKGKSRQ